jgi:membrane associated rhomboid family serine protease
MLPLSDGVPTKRFPIVNTLLIVANVAVWLFYELPNLDSAVAHSSLYPCTVSGACHGPEPWWLSWFTAMFLHASWSHIAGNMLSWRSSATTSRMRSVACVTWCSTSPAGSRRP